MSNYPTTWQDVPQAIEEELSNFAINLIRKKPRQEKEPSRVSLYVIGAAALLLLALLDLISAIAVGSITNFFYGFLTFAIGVGSLSVAEVGYFWPFAGTWQKRFAIFDVFLSIGSTLLIGSLAAIVNAINYFQVFDTGQFKGLIEIAMLICLVLIGVTHGILGLSYIFVDAGVQRNQKAQQNRAANKERHETLALAEQDMTQSIQMGQRLLGLAHGGKGGVLRESIKNLTGEDLLEGIEVPAGVRKNGNGHSPTQ